MAKKSDSALEEIRKLLKTKRLVIGTERTIKAIKTGKLSKVVYSSNCPKDVKSDIEQYCKLGNIDAIDLDIANDELGVICKKPFSISVVGIAHE